MSCVQRDLSKSINWLFSKNFADQKSMAQYMQSDMEKTYNQEYSTQQGYHLDLTKR